MPASDALADDCLRVLPISPGLAIGPVYLYGRIVDSAAQTAPQLIDPSQAGHEQERLRAAIAAALADLRQVSEQVARTAGSQEAAIFEAHQLMLQDPELIDEAQALIAQRHYAPASAMRQAAEHNASELEALHDNILSARAADIRDAANRVIRHLVGEQSPSLAAITSPVILLAHDLAPSDTAGLDPQTILGICTVVGGPTTHAAILARALEIPAVAGLQPAQLEKLRAGQQIAIDGSRGLLYLLPGVEQQHVFGQAMQSQREERRARRDRHEAIWRARPGSTADGVAVQIFANVGDAAAARAAAEAGAEGIGLLRTEFLFSGRPVFPGEEEQFESYFELFRAFIDAGPPGSTIIARTLDAGADKPFPALEPLIGPLQEANPALGLRGARIHLAHEPLLRQQLRALLRAAVSTGASLHVMYPMIATLEEVRRLNAIFAAVREELQSENVAVPYVPSGIMIETPAAALMADALAREVDFFSIGANDLFQYTLAADRTNSRVMSMFGALEPSVWRLIDHVVQAGRAQGKLVALCGELASDQRIGPCLAGMGVQELSMNPPSISLVKAALHAHPMSYWQQLAQQLLLAETGWEMQKVLAMITSI